MLRRRVLVGTAIAVVVLAVTAIVVAVVIGIRVIGPSMRPTLQDGDRVVVNPFDHSSERFDLVAVRFADGAPLVVKRVVALPGDRVRIGPGPEVLVQPDGTGPWYEVDNPAWRGQWSRTVPMPEAVVPTGSLFVLGDNPDGSEDSRALGWAPLRLVGGTVRLRVYPLDRLGRPPGDVRLQPHEPNG